MKNTRFILATVLTGTFACAAPLDHTQVARDTQWLAHLDIDGLRQSEVGELLLSLLKDSLPAELPVSVNADVVFAELHSLTAYGSTFDENPELNSVLIIRAGERANAIIDGFAAGIELEGGNTKGFQVVTGKAFPTYLMGQEVFLGLPRRDLILVSKDFARIEQAFAVIEGRAPALEGTGSNGAPHPRNFFFVASADGLDLSKNLPPQARILQRAKGARLAFGENSGDLIGNLALVTANPEVSSQLRRIMDGMVALLSFAETSNPLVASLTRSMSVTESADGVTVSVRYPVAAIEPMIASLRKGGPAAPAAPAAADAPPPASDGIGGQLLRVSNVDARSDNGNLARNATDGNPGTFWGAVGNNQWIRLELEHPSLVREIQIAWRGGGERAVPFSIQASDNGVQWTRMAAFRSSGQNAELESFDVPNTTTRWIRILRGGGGMVGISELRILGEPQTDRAIAPGSPASAAQ